MNITINQYDSKTNTSKEVIVDLYSIAKALDAPRFCNLISDFVNAGGKGQREGEKIGEILRTEHRTLQACVIKLCLGIIIGLSKQEYTDARNDYDVKMAKKIAKMVETGELQPGAYI